MDVVAYLKDRVKQPSGRYSYVYRNDVFDFHINDSEVVVNKVPNTLIDVSEDNYVEANAWHIENNAEVVGDSLILGEDVLYEDLPTEYITCEEICEDADELQQACLFATLKQRGSDPLAPDEGVRWSEAYIGEISQEILMADIQNAVKSVSPSVLVDFSTVSDASGNEYLTYILKVPSGVVYDS